LIIGLAILPFLAGNALAAERLNAEGFRPAYGQVAFNKGIGGGATTPLRVAVQLDQLAAVDALAALGADVNDPLALDFAVGGNRLEIARHLLNEGADPNQIDRRGITPLVYAAASDFGDAAMAKLLLDWGADPGLRDQDGQTPLDRARERGNSAVIALLERVASDRRPRTQ
jgi:ankyrin repeat protein